MPAILRDSNLTAIGISTWNASVFTSPRGRFIALGQVTTLNMAFAWCIIFVSFLWLGIFQILFLVCCSYLTALGIGTVGHFPTLQCTSCFMKDNFFQINPGSILQICRTFPQICPQDIHTSGVASGWLYPDNLQGLPIGAASPNQRFPGRSTAITQVMISGQTECVKREVRRKLWQWRQTFFFQCQTWLEI